MVKLIDNVELPQLIMGCKNVDSFNFVELAYSQGIKSFSIPKIKYDMLKKFVGMSTVVLFVSVESINDIDKLLTYTLDTIPIINADITNYKELTDILHELYINRKITYYGVSTDVVLTAVDIIKSGTKLVQIPYNIIETGFFHRIQPYIQTFNPTLILHNIFGKGYVLNKIDNNFILKSTRANAGHNFISINMEKEEDIINTLKNFNHTIDGIYLTMMDTCNNCQECNDVCMLGNNLCEAVKYSRYMDEPAFVEFGKTGLARINLSFDCMECKKCSHICPTELQVRDYIQNHVNLL